MPASLTARGEGSTAWLALLSQTFPQGPARAQAFGLWGAASGSGGALGVLGGGVIVETLGWRWTLLVNVPIGLALLALLIFGNRTPHPTARPHLDLAGSTAFLVATASLVLAVMSVSNSFTAAGWAFLGLVSVVTFVLIEKRAASPLIPFVVVPLRVV